MALDPGGRGRLPGLVPAGMGGGKGPGGGRGGGPCREMFPTKFNSIQTVKIER